MNEAYVKPSVYIQSIKDNMRPRRGRPVSTGTGKKICVYLPQKTLELIDRISQEWAFDSQSELIQESIARYAADLDGVTKEGEDHA